MQVQLKGFFEHRKQYSEEKRESLRELEDLFGMPFALFQWMELLSQYKPLGRPLLERSWEESHKSERISTTVSSVLFLGLSSFRVQEENAQCACINVNINKIFHSIPLG